MRRKNSNGIRTPVISFAVILTVAVLFVLTLFPRPQAALTFTSNSVSCSVASTIPPQFSCIATITGDFSSGTVTWTTSGTGSGNFVPEDTCTLNELNSSSSQCEVIYEPSATDTQVSIYAMYSGDSQNEPSNGMTTINIAQLTQTSIPITSSAIVTTNSRTTSATSQTLITSATVTSSSIYSSSVYQIALSGSKVAAEILSAGIVMGALLLGFLVVTRKSKQ